MNDHPRPLPPVSDLARPFWEAARRHELLIQQCRACGSRIFFPKARCPQCLSHDLEWIRASGRGKVYSFSRIYAAPPQFMHDGPYVAAIVELEEGVRMFSNIVDCDAGAVHCDMPVTVMFEKVTEEITLPKFRPA